SKRKRFLRIAEIVESSGEIEPFCEVLMRDTCRSKASIDEATAIEEEFENYKREKEDTLQLAYEAIEAAKEEAAKAERNRILDLINTKEN
ncbi:MAG: hypothetical protein IKS78_06725, partial [Clostridia bacterium]|nr:hypothetical protein [Clostridia bacterium]